MRGSSSSLTPGNMNVGGLGCCAAVVIAASPKCTAGLGAKISLLRSVFPLLTDMILMPGLEEVLECELLSL